MGFFSNALKAVKFVAPVEDTSSAAPAPSATPTATLPANTANAPENTPYTVSPQNISIGETRYRALPVNMLSRLSLASLKDILSMYDKEGEDVPKMADGGEVDRPELIAQLGQVPSSSQANTQPAGMTQEEFDAYKARTGRFGGTTGDYFGAVPIPANVYADAQDNLYWLATGENGNQSWNLGSESYAIGPDGRPVIPAASTSKVADGYKVPAYDPSKDPMVERGYTRLTGDPTELGFKLRECGPMGCVAPQVLGTVYNPTTGQYFQTGAGNPFEEMPEGWLYTSAQGTIKPIYGERGPIEQMPIAPNPVAPTAPESPYIVNPYRINMGETRVTPSVPYTVNPYQVNIGQSQSTPVQPSRPTDQGARPAYQMPQYQAPAMPSYLQEYVDRTSGNNAPLQATLMDFLRRQRMV